MYLMSARLHKHWHTSQERHVSFSLMETIGRDICIHTQILRASVYAARGCTNGHEKHGCFLSALLQKSLCIEGPG